MIATLSDEWKEGFAAGQQAARGIVLTCPYLKDTPRYDDWVDGYVTGSTEEEYLKNRDDF
jgi:hypothetical protein